MGGVLSHARGDVASVGAGPTPVRQRKQRAGAGRASRLHRGVHGLVLLVPAVAMMLAVSLYPVLRTFWLATRNTSLAAAQDEFVGAENVQRLWGDAQFWNAWTQTLVFTGTSTLLETLLGVAIALVLYETFRGRGFVRAAVLVPWAIPTVVTSRMFGWLFDGQNGVVNYLLVQLGITDHYVNFLGDTAWALPTLILADVWKTTPFMALLVLAALQTISPSLLESARMDGAGPLRTFFAVRLPLILPALLIAALLRTLDAFRIFDLPYVLTGGGPADSTETLSTLAYKRLFSGLELGYGSTMATAMFVTEVLIAVGFAVFLVRRFRTVGS